MKKSMVIFANSMAILFALSCKEINGLIDPKTEQQKTYEYLQSGVWSADSIRTIGRSVDDVVYSDTNFFGRKITFSGTPTYDQKGVMTFNYKQKGKDTTYSIPFTTDGIIISLYYPSGSIYIELSYTILEASNNKFAFVRDVDLLSPIYNQKYGSTRSAFRLSK